MAKFEKGNPGNLQGRGKGTPNVSTREARITLNRALFGELDNIRESLLEVRKADHAKYLELMVKLLAFVIPRKMDLTTDDEPINAGFLGMTKVEIEAEIALWKTL